MTGLLVPTVIQPSPRGERAYDIYSRLLEERIVFVGTIIDDASANLAIAQLLHLEADAPERDITLYINSPGGSVTAGFGILDAMTYVAPDVATVCVGQAASFGAVLLAAGTKGKRAALPNARILLHQPHGGAEGQTSDVAIQAKEMLRMRARIEELMCEWTGQPAGRIERDMERDFILVGEEAVDYGVIDHVIDRRVAAADGAEPARLPG